LNEEKENLFNIIIWNLEEILYKRMITRLEFLGASDAKLGPFSNKGLRDHSNYFMRDLVLIGKY